MLDYVTMLDDSPEGMTWIGNCPWCATTTISDDAGQCGAMLKVHIVERHVIA